MDTPYPYFSRRLRCWSRMKSATLAELDQGLDDAGGCLDAPTQIPAGCFDSEEDIPSPSYTPRQGDE